MALREKFERPSRDRRGNAPERGSRDRGSSRRSSRDEEPEEPEDEDEDEDEPEERPARGSSRRSSRDRDEPARGSSRRSSRDEPEERPARGSSSRRSSERGSSRGGRGGRKRKSKYAGLSSRAPRAPIAYPGRYVVKILEAIGTDGSETGNECTKIKFEILDIVKDGKDGKHQIGDEAAAIFVTSGKAGRYGLERTKAFFVATAGFEDDDGYDEFDPDGELMDAVLEGDDNAYADLVEEFIGREVEVLVTRGNEMDDGTDFYRDFQWFNIEDPLQAP